VELITKNSHKLSIDSGDIRAATASRIFEGVMTSNIGSVPFFVGRNEHGVAVVKRVALPRSPNGLDRFFAGPGGEYEFFPVGDPRLIAALADALQKIYRQSAVEGRRPSHAELEMYLYREPDPDAPEEWVLRWASELEFESDAGREAFIQTAMEQEEFRFVKLVATYLEEADAKYLDRLLAPVRAQSKHRALKLGEELRSIFGYGELIDITEDIVLPRRPSA
jgi:hypothetical protein